MLDQLTIKCACSERFVPNEYDNHMERCSNVTFTCPHTVCQEKVNNYFYFINYKIKFFYLIE